MSNIIDQVKEQATQKSLNLLFHSVKKMNQAQLVDFMGKIAEDTAKKIFKQLELVIEVEDYYLRKQDFDRAKETWKQ